MGFLKSIFGGSNNEEKTENESVVYEGFTITTTPKNVNNGWSTEGVITKPIEGVEKTHHFIRADTSGSKEGAIELTISKAKTLIDQAGIKIFSD